jgi:hypothetical protein
MNYSGIFLSNRFHARLNGRSQDFRVDYSARVESRVAYECLRQSNIRPRLTIINALGLKAMAKTGAKKAEESRGKQRKAEESRGKQRKGKKKGKKRNCPRDERTSGGSMKKPGKVML